MVNKKEYMKKYYQKNRKQRLEYQQRYEKINKEKIAKRVKQYYKNNKKKRQEINRKYYKNHKKEVLKKANEYARNNKKKIAERMKLWYKDNKKEIDLKIKQFNKEFKKKHGIHYNTLHTNIRKERPNQKYCTICNQDKRLDIASIGHTYTKEPEDYIYLCRDCHHLFDRIIKNNKKGENKEC